MSKKPVPIRVYLAGPGIFSTNAEYIAAHEKMKTELLIGELEMQVFDPRSKNIKRGDFPNTEAFSRAIITEEKRMLLRQCCAPGGIGIVLMDMNPFRGVSMDVGTAGEALLAHGFALGTGEKNVIVMGYTADKRMLAERATEYYQNNVTKSSSGLLMASDETWIESLGHHENCVIIGAIQDTGGEICETPAQAARRGKELAEQRIKKLGYGSVHRRPTGHDRKRH